MDLTRQALQGAQNDPRLLLNAAFALAHFGMDVGAMIELVDRALVLTPSFARGWHLSAVMRNLAGQPDVAIEHLEASLRLSPREHIGSYLVVMGQAYFFKHRFDEAAVKLLLAIQESAGSPPRTAFWPLPMPIWGGSTK